MEQKIRENQALVIFGYYEASIFCYTNIREEYPNLKIVFCDNNSTKQGKQPEGNVLAVEVAVREFPEAAYLVVNRHSEVQMRKQLLSLGIPGEKIYTYYSDEIQQYMDFIKKEKCFKVRSKIQFEVNLVSHCNLNCKSCSQFSPISKEEYIDLGVLERDFDRMGKLFNGEAERIYLIGGEPLLHPHIEKCMEIARMYFPHGRIELFTNGILLFGKEEYFWKTCREQNIKITTTKYPVNIDYAGMKKLANSHGIVFEFFESSGDYKYMSNLGLDESGSQEPEKSFVRCNESNSCIKLRDGKLFTCTRPAVIDKYNDYFKANFTVSKEDYIDIYEAESGSEILEFLSKPIPFCRYCDTSRKEAHEWGQSKRNKEEWL